MRRLYLVPMFALFACPSVPAGEPLPAAATGAQLFDRLCASCHGARGTGDGPVAGALKVRPADLTRLSAGNGGAFPAGRVRDMIDGRAAQPAHGTREMPVWGYELEARAPAAAPGRATAQAQTDLLVEHLRAMQR